MTSSEMNEFNQVPKSIIAQEPLISGVRNQENLYSKSIFNSDVFHPDMTSIVFQISFEGITPTYLLLVSKREVFVQCDHVLSFLSSQHK